MREGGGESASESSPHIANSSLNSSDKLCTQTYKDTGVLDCLSMLPPQTFSFEAVCGSITLRRSWTSWLRVRPTFPLSITNVCGVGLPSDPSSTTWLRFLLCGREHHVGWVLNRICGSKNFLCVQKLVQEPLLCSHTIPSPFLSFPSAQGWILARSPKNVTRQPRHAHLSEEVQCFTSVQFR